MKSRLLLIIVPLIAGLHLSGCGNVANGEEAGSEADKEEPGVPVEVADVTRATVYAAYQGTTTLEAEQEADIVAKTGGVILELLVEEGDRVEQGQVVARLDRERLDLEYRQSQATLDKLENDFERTRELYEKKLVSRDAYDRIRYDLESQRATLDLVALELSYSNVSSPISGVVSERLVKVGNLVALHQTLFRVDDFDPLLAVLHVPERELSTLRKGQEAIVTFDAIGSEAFVGDLARISPVVDPNTGTFKVTVEISEPDPRLKPGMFGRVNIVHETHEDVVTVPKDALIIEDRGSYVFVAEHDTARKVSVETGYTTAGRVEILGGLEVGQRVVTAGKGSLSDTARIDVINAREDTEALVAGDAPAIAKDPL